MNTEDQTWAVDDPGDPPEGTARRQARKLLEIEGMIDDELERLRRRGDLFPAGRFSFLRRRWIDGVYTSRQVTEERLRRIKDAFYGSGFSDGVGTGESGVSEPESAERPTPREPYDTPSESSAESETSRHA